MINSVQKDSGIPRPPVVGIFGHIDHGKSTLIDYIRKTNITEKEAGGITQHISAYEVRRAKPDGAILRITFLDTPGHEAFSQIRTRGANVADIAVLVVSAEDGVKPQTLEVYKYIKESALPHLVAITKVDKPAADLERTKASLAEHGILVEGYGGEVPVVALSATTGQGVEEFLDMITLLAEMENLTGEADALGSGVIVEASLDPKRGVSAVGIVKDGTVRIGTFAACGDALVPIRFILDGEGNAVEELSFSAPIGLVGWDKLPTIGQEFKTFLKKEDAVEYTNQQRTTDNQPQRKAEELAEGVVILPIILKADTAGSLEAIENELKKISKDRIVPKIIMAGVGSINENDVKSAITTTGAVIFGFHARIDAPALALSERSNIKILNYNIIYELTAKVAELLTERAPKVETEEVTGSAKVLKIFSATKDKQVVGARVLSGNFDKNAQVKILRREAEIGKGRVRELQQSKLAVSSVGEGVEFGTMIESKVEIAPGDTLEVITLVTK
ncbi:MAG: translation initiation factor IF-2 [bacterium]|nr:translation initiation factor IF-2 [bacterium]